MADILVYMSIKSKGEKESRLVVDGSLTLLIEILQTVYQAQIAAGKEPLNADEILEQLQDKYGK